MNETWAVRTFRNKERIFSEGEQSDGAFLVKSGTVRVFRERDGHETELGVIRPGETLGEMSLIDAKPRNASAAAIGDVQVAFISKGWFREAVGDDFVWSLLQDMSKRLRAMDDAFQKLESEKSAKITAVSNWTERRTWLV